MPIYMKIEPAIAGEVTAEGHKDEIEITSYQWGVGVGVESPHGGSGKRSTSTASFSEVTMTTSLNNAIGPIIDHLAGGNSVDKVTISFVKATNKDKAGNDKYYIVTLEDVFFSGVSLSSGGDSPSVSLTLNYGKIKAEYHKSDAKGVLTKGVGHGWDLTTNKSYA